MLVHTPWTLKFFAALPSLRKEAPDSSAKLKATWTCLLGYKYENRRNFNNSRLEHSVIQGCQVSSSCCILKFNINYFPWSLWNSSLITNFEAEGETSLTVQRWKEIFWEMRKYSWQRTRDKFLGKTDYKWLKFFGQLNHIWNIERTLLHTYRILLVNVL